MNQVKFDNNRNMKLSQNLLACEVECFPQIVMLPFVQPNKIPLLNSVPYLLRLHR